MKNAQEFGTLSKEVSNHLDINPNTLRRWSLELEKHEYIFERNDKGQRIYYKRDINTLSELKIILNKGQSMEVATKTIASSYKDKKNSEKTLGIIIKNEENNENYSLSKRELENIVEVAVERAVGKAVEEEREEMFKAFEKKMDDAVERRDRLLMQSINRTMEEKRLGLATETEKETHKKEKFSFLSLFKKK